MEPRLYDLRENGLMGFGTVVWEIIMGIQCIRTELGPKHHLPMGIVGESGRDGPLERTFKSRRHDLAHM